MQVLGQPGLELETPHVAKRNKLVIVCSKGSLDMAYPPLMLATTGAAMGMEVDLYFTFWGINMLRKKTVDSLKISPVGNPAMPMPNILGMIPGMTRLATRMMKKSMTKMKMPTVQDMIKTAHDAGVRFHACSPSMQMMNLTKDDLIPEVDDIIGATTYLDLASDDAITLFI
jgi:peroxiredoxin family protein